MSQIWGTFTLKPLDWRGPLAGNYWAAVAMVLAALAPFLVLSAAIPPLDAMIGHDVGLGSGGLEISAGMADAALFSLAAIAACGLLWRRRE